MITSHNLPTLKSTTAVLLKMEESPFNFHLTGSRFFGDHNVDSDYDFFTKDTPEVRIFLESLGLEAQHISQYSEDQLLTAVYHLELEDDRCQILPGFEGIDVQLVEELDDKIFCQETLKEFYPHGLPGKKTGHSDLWNLVLASHNKTKHGLITPRVSFNDVDEAFAKFTSSIRPQLVMGELQTVAAFTLYLKTGQIPGTSSD